MKSNSIITRETVLDKIKIGLLVALILFGGVIKIGNLRLFGIVPTAYRIGIPILALYYICRFFINKQSAKKTFSKAFVIFACMMAFWLLYGGIALILFTYADHKEGLKELLSLLLGLLSVYCIYESCYDKRTIGYFFEYLRVSCVIMCFIALIEMFTGYHLSSSAYAEQSVVILNDSKMLIGLYTSKLFPATSIFYGCNDFSVLISILLPIFYFGFKDKLWVKIADIAMIVIIVFILAVNDANIALMGVFAGLLVYFILSCPVWKFSLGFFAVVFAVQQWGAKWMCRGFIAIKKFFWTLSGSDAEQLKNSIGDVGGPGVESSFSISDVVSSQVKNAAGGTGSLHHRISLYMNALESTWETHGLGLGPAGFMKYYSENPKRTYLVNPHNWWLEIMSQYGIFVFAAYTFAMLYLFIMTVKLYIKKHIRAIAIILAMCTTFVISCLAPSSFIGYSYQWILPALCISALKVYSTEKDYQKKTAKVIASRDEEVASLDAEA